MDIYFEQSVTNEKIDKRKKRNKILSIVRYVVLAAGIILGYVLFTVTMFTPLENGWTAVAIQAVVGILAIVPFVLAFIFMGKHISNGNMEYDYFVVNGNFRIIKVINRKKRKRMLEFSLSSIENMGKIESDTYDRYAASKDIKKVFALCNTDDEENIIYIYYGSDGAKQLLHIEPNDDMLIALKRSVARMTVLDKSLKMPAASTLSK